MLMTYVLVMLGAVRSKAVSYLQTNNSACHSSMDAGRRYKAPGSKSEDFITHSTARASYLCHIPFFGVMLSQAKAGLLPAEARETRNEFSPAASGGSTALPVP